MPQSDKSQPDREHSAASPPPAAGTTPVGKVAASSIPVYPHPRAGVDQPTKNESGASGETAGQTDASPRIAFDDVACGCQQVQIEYRGQIYYLRTTRNGKLILNK